MSTIIIVGIVIALVIGMVWMARVLDAANQLPPPTVPPEHHDAQPQPRPIPAAQPVQKELVREFIPGRVYEVSFRKKDGTVRHYGRFLVVFSRPNGLIDGIVLDQEVMLYFPDTKEAGVGAKQAGFMPSQVLAANETQEYSPSQMKLICEVVRKVNRFQKDSDLMELYDLLQIMDRE
jgi:hypothetical protein